MVCLRARPRARAMHANYFSDRREVHQDLPPKLPRRPIWAFCDPFLKVLRRHRGVLLTEKPHLQAAQTSGSAWSKLADAWGWGWWFFPVSWVRGSGRRLGPAQSAALRMLFRARFRHPDRARTATITTATASAWRRCASRCAHHENSAWRSCACPEGGGAGCRPGTTKIVPPLRAEMKRSMEATIHHFKALQARGHHVPRRPRSTPRVEAPKGEVRASTWWRTATNRPYKCKIRGTVGSPICRPMDFLSRGGTCWPMSRRSSARSTPCSGRIDR